MFSRVRLVVAAFLLSALAIPAPAQTTQPRTSRQTRPTPATASTESESAVASGLKAKIFDVKHRELRPLLIALNHLGSGAKGAAMSASEEFRTITVRDFPANLAVIEEAIKRLDQPEAPAPDIEFQIHILVASSEPSVPEEVFPAPLAQVVLELKSTLKYRSYTLMASAIQRAKASGHGASLNNTGVASTKLLGTETPYGNPVFYNYQLKSIALDSTSQGGPRVQIGSVQFGMRVPLNLGQSTPVQYENIGFNTPLTLRDGERVVVGTTTVQEKGIAFVVSAKLLKQ
jgi:hypothetical protein